MATTKASILAKIGSLLSFGSSNGLKLPADAAANDEAVRYGQAEIRYRDASNLDAGAVPVARLGEADTRYGQLVPANDWSGENKFPKGAAVEVPTIALSSAITDWPLGYSVMPVDGNSAGAPSTDYSTLVTFRASNTNAGFQILAAYGGATGGDYEAFWMRSHRDIDSTFQAWQKLAITAQLTPTGVGLSNVTNDKQVPAAGGTFTGQIGVPDGTASGDAINYGQAEARYRNASNLNAGDVPTARLTGSYDIDITGSAAKLGSQPPLYYLSTQRSKAALSSADDLNSIADGGWYGWAGSEPTNAPSGAGTYCHMLVTNGASSNKSQTVWQMGSSDNARVWVRRYWGGIWKPWFEYAFHKDLPFLFGGISDQTANRVLGTTYTNSTGRPMLVTVTTYTTVSSGSLFYINGSLVGRQGINSHNETGEYGCISMIVPAGATYEVTGSSLAYWQETY
jgi:hypothetical protein